MKKISAVLFDFDGTLMDTNDIILKSWQHTFRHVLGREEDEEVLLNTFGEPLALTMQNFFGVEGEALQECMDIYRSFQKDTFLDSIALFPGITEMLQELKDAGFTLALVTSRLKETTLQGVEKFGLAPYFDVIVTANDCTKHKPDPQPINITLEKLGISPEEAVMLGDTVMDMGCARNAGVISVLVGWSAALPEHKITPEDRPDHIIRSADALLPLLEDLNRQRETL